MDPSKITPAEASISEMMVDLYSFQEKLITQSKIQSWHQMLMKGRSDIKNIGLYRNHDEPMQIVYGPPYKRKVHFEAPPSSNVLNEMNRLMEWYKKTHPSSKNSLPALLRAGISHTWFESIHPFEDGNGRLGRAFSERILGEHLSKPYFISLATSLNSRRKEYYEQLGKASKSIDISDWLCWFADRVLEAQNNISQLVKIIHEKIKFFKRLENKINIRQERVLLRMFKEGPGGFKGGLSATNYASISGAPPLPQQQET